MYVPCVTLYVPCVTQLLASINSGVHVCTCTKRIQTQAMRARASEAASGRNNTYAFAFKCLNFEDSGALALFFYVSHLAVKNFHCNGNNFSFQEFLTHNNAGNASGRSRQYHLCTAVKKGLAACFSTCVQLSLFVCPEPVLSRNISNGKEGHTWIPRLFR